MSSWTSIRKKNFTCPDQARIISKQLETFYKEKVFCDVSLIAGIDNIKTKAHRIILSASSNYFFTIFRNDWNVTNSAEVELKVENVNGITLNAILDFMYAASIEFDSQTVNNVLSAAQRFQMNNLVAACCNFMGEQLDSRTCLGLLCLAEEHGYTELKAKSLAYAYQHFEQVCTEKEFFQLREHQLNNFLSGDNFRVTSQEILFRSLVEWFKYDEVNREQTLYSLLLQYVRFSLLEPKFIVENRKKLNHVPKCSELMCSWLEWHLLHQKLKKQTKEIVFIYRAVKDFQFNVQTFNPTLNKWSYENWPSPLNDKTDYSMLLLNNKLILTGGLVNEKATDRVECLDIQSLEWYQLPSMKSKRYNHAMAEINGDVYVVGGQNDQLYLTSVEKYNFSTGTWQTITNLSRAPRWVKVAVLNGLLYVASYGLYYVDYYDPSTDTWNKTPLKREKLSLFGMAAVKGYLYTVGGEDRLGHKSATVEQYDPETNNWTVIEPLKSCRRWISCTEWNDHLFACGGLQDDTNIAKTLEEYDPQSNEWKTLAPLLHFTSMNSYSAHFSAIKYN